MNSAIRKIVPVLTFLMALPVWSVAATSVPVGTPIDVTIHQSISSKTATVGQTLGGVISRDVTARARVVIAKGSSARLVVSSVQPQAGCPLPPSSGCDSRGSRCAAKASRFPPAWPEQQWVAKAGAGALPGGLAGGGNGAATGKKEVEFPGRDALRVHDAGRNRAQLRPSTTHTLSPVRICEKIE
jgi:hypothetical protein